MHALEGGENLVGTRSPVALDMNHLSRTRLGCDCVALDFDARSTVGRFLFFNEKNSGISSWAGGGVNMGGCVG